tara:strand:+ start:640 stop:1140 length:501 start_codon:yes stop_codon:yes gene_type:complete
MPETTLLFSEILDLVHKAKTKDKKVEILRKYNSDALRMVIKSSFDPNIVWVMPKGNVPYTPNDAPAGTEHTRLATEAKKLFRFIRGGDNITPQFKKEQMFVQLLEGLHKDEAELICYAKDKQLHKIVKGLSAPVVRQAFGWDEDFMQIDLTAYPQGSRSASGLVDE